MFCANCGKQVSTGTNFCPACGTRVVSPEPLGSSASDPAASASNGAAGASRSSWTGVPPPSRRLLVRPRSPRVLGGVCAGFALYYGWNLDVVRILAAILALFYGLGVLAYAACWIILPEAPYALPQQSR